MMSERETCNWLGASKRSYGYYLYELSITFDPNQDGNYIYCKLLNNRWRPIYIGQGELRDRVSENHHKAKCIKEKGATHVHAYLNPNEKDRIAEEEDLLNNYTQAYEPMGCNEKLGR